MLTDYCVGCGATEYLETHHIAPKMIGGDDDPKNLIHLCWSCHARVHNISREKPTSYYIREKFLGMCPEEFDKAFAERYQDFPEGMSYKQMCDILNKEQFLGKTDWNPQRMRNEVKRHGFKPKYIVTKKLDKYKDYKADTSASTQVGYAEELHRFQKYIQPITLDELFEDENKLVTVLADYIRNRGSRNKAAVIRTIISREYKKIGEKKLSLHPEIKQAMKDLYRSIIT